MENRLPPGFDPAVWKGWEVGGYPGGIIRDMADGSTASVIRYADNVWSFGDSEGYRSDAFPTESEAAAFANTYAENHGGFV